MSEKITGERNSYARELRGQKEGLDGELEIGSELRECVTGLEKNKNRVLITHAFGYILLTTGWIPDLRRLEKCAAGRTLKRGLFSFEKRPLLSYTTL